MQAVTPYRNGAGCFALSRLSLLLTACAAYANSVFAASTSHITGEWSAVLDWPVMAIHAHLMPNGKVLAWDASPDDADLAPETRAASKGTRVTLWDPLTNQHTRVDSIDTILFCSGHAHLPDGRLFTAGGTIGPGNNSIADTKVFDHELNTWLAGPSMSFARWYPTVTTLGNGEMLITSGRVSTPEIFGTDGQLRSLTGAILNLPLYPMMNLAPNGLVFNAGPGTLTRFLNTTGNGAWQNSIQRDATNRDYGSHAMYDIGKILVAGGGASVNTAVVLDINNAAQVTATGSLNFGRRQHNLTILPNGKVLATGGISNGAALVDLNAPVFAAEIWDPATGLWSEMASESVVRQYHSTALLLPDGRVVSAGGGFCGSCSLTAYNNKNAQVFSPPYLFKPNGSGELAPRPTIAAAPDILRYAQNFDISTPEAAGIARVALTRLSSVTHSNNMEQRYVPLGFNAGAGSLNVSGPGNENLAPPGAYMLFLVDSAGVPSIAKMVQVRNSNQAPTAVISASPTAGASPLTVAFSGTGSSDPDGDTLTYAWNFGDGQTGSGAALNHTYTSPGAYTATLTVTDPSGASNSKTQTISVSSTTGNGTGLRGQYYDRLGFKSLRINRVDPSVNFDWGSAAPSSTMGSNTFSVRWTGQVVPRFSETYTFYTRTDDGVRLRVNGNLIIDKWIDQGATEWSGSITLQAGQAYSIQMDFYENQGSASASLSWSSASQPKQIIPASQLIPGP